MPSTEPFLLTSPTIANTLTVDRARTILGFSSTILLTSSSIRQQFRKTVLTGHSDRGGELDIQLLCLARDCLLNFTVDNIHCAECSDQVCAYHRMFPL